MPYRPEFEPAMLEALRLARRGFPGARPNPLVGAVVLKAGRIVGRGAHERFGGPHAEVAALADAGRKARGGVLVVTLEPCSHFGKTPPCTDAILAAGVTRVVAATLDPNPEVSGRGAALLRRRGVRVEVGCLAARALALNEGYFSAHVRRRPWVTLKMASTLDGKLAAADGTSRYISGPETLRLAHRLRIQHHAILVGRHTVESDDPQLTPRLARGPAPVRVILDSRGRLGADRQVFDVEQARTVWVTAPGVPGVRIRRLTGRGVEHLEAPRGKGGGLLLPAVLRLLLRLGLHSVLVEGGAGVATSFLRASLVDRLVLTIAPKLLGGGNLASLGDLGIRSMKDILTLSTPRVTRMGEDAVFRGDLIDPLEMLEGWDG